MKGNPHAASFQVHQTEAMLDQMCSVHGAVRFRCIRFATFLLLLAMVGVTVGCDAVNVHYNEATGQRAGDDPDSFTKAEMFFEPVALSPGELFSIDLIDDQHDSPVARIVHQRTADGELLLSADSDVLNAEAVSIKCRNQETVVQREETRLMSPTTAKAGNAQMVATSDQEPSSFHYYDNGETVLVEVDYEGEEESQASGPGQALIQFPSSDQSIRCTHVGFVLDGVSTAISANGVRFSGVREEPTIRKQEFQRR